MLFIERHVPILAHLVLCPTNNCTYSQSWPILGHAPFQTAAFSIPRAASTAFALGGRTGNPAASRTALPHRSGGGRGSARPKDCCRSPSQSPHGHSVAGAFPRARVGEGVEDRARPGAPADLRARGRT